VHPNKVHKKGAARVNLSQRVPHLAKDILDHPQEYTLLAEAFSDFFEILRVVVSLFLATAFIYSAKMKYSLHNIFPRILWSSASTAGASLSMPPLPVIPLADLLLTCKHVLGRTAMDSTNTCAW
jgi:hypothetical protein